MDAKKIYQTLHVLINNNIRNFEVIFFAIQGKNNSLWH